MKYIFSVILIDSLAEHETLKIAVQIKVLHTQGKGYKYNDKNFRPIS